MKAVELFAGAGGLAMGISLAGFESAAVVEWDRWACDTLRENKRRGFPLLADWPIWESDVQKFNWKSLSEVDLVAGGPPCQPFSMGGKHGAQDDRRNMFPATVEIIRKLRPKAFIIENVKGLTRQAFANYYQYILLQLEFPEIYLKINELWEDHFRRLQIERTSGEIRRTGLSYNVNATLANAADYGVPQKRERVFIVGFRSDLSANWSFPEPTHSEKALLHTQLVSGEYWDRHKVATRERQSILLGRSTKVAGAQAAKTPGLAPWATVRDSISDLPDPRRTRDSIFRNHQFQKGARSYAGHTGSPMDLPAKTLKAGDHGVPGGENMLVYPSGEIRYFTVREAARLQTIPDGYVFHGSWSETMRQLGNAVPVVLAAKVASSVAAELANCGLRKAETLSSRMRA